MNKNIHLFIFFIIVNNAGFSQDISPVTLNSTGGTYKGAFMTFEWSVGEVTAIETMSYRNLVLTNGILQPFTTVKSTSTQWDPTELKIYPVPTNDLLTLDFFILQKGYITTRLYDATGRLIENRKFFYDGTPQKIKMDLTSYGSGTYILKVEMDVQSLLSDAIQKKGIYKVQILK